MSSTSSRVLP